MILKEKFGNLSPPTRPSRSGGYQTPYCSAFPEPNRLDISRQPNRHLSFGYGDHLRLGADLARLKGAIAKSCSCFTSAGTRGTEFRNLSVYAILLFGARSGIKQEQDPEQEQELEY